MLIFPNKCITQSKYRILSVIQNMVIAYIPLIWGYCMVVMQPVNYLAFSPTLPCCMSQSHVIFNLQASKSHVTKLVLTYSANKFYYSHFLIQCNLIVFIPVKCPLIFSSPRTQPVEIFLNITKQLSFSDLHQQQICLHIRHW